ncbi:cAMP-dependent protein kinase type 1 [Smittium culicis]|uniref:cAMP-dependent protein kinase n=1 Tax=Smittium culicis TaxID=133412 RepID=A0A1R1XBN5_9FUNG|nr:cAMP-dependent protein kinase type 1 [Smittium culicis]
MSLINRLRNSILKTKGEHTEMNNLSKEDNNTIRVGLSGNIDRSRISNDTVYDDENVSYSKSNGISHGNTTSEGIKTGFKQIPISHSGNKYTNTTTKSKSNTPQPIADKSVFGIIGVDLSPRIRNKSDDTIEVETETTYKTGSNISKSSENIDMEIEANNVYSLKNNNNEGYNSELDRIEFNVDKVKSNRIDINDYEFFRTIGTGSFGRVKIVRQTSTSDFYAVKILRKSEVVRAKQVEHVNNERAVLAFCNSPFIVKLHGCYQDSINLYMFLEYIIGGELFSYLRRYKKFPSPVAKFYAGEVALAFEYLHSYDLVYRDLKPENILLDSNGHVKLTDLGFAKYVTDVTWTLCGTPDYLAPEIIQAKGYGRAVDWYSLGVLIFEMIAGYPPYYDRDHYKLYERILSGRVRWPNHFDPIARDLVEKLITSDLSSRYGNLKNGSKDIKNHPWFEEVNWKKLARLEIAAPLIPAKKSGGDTGNFDRYPESHENYGDMSGPDVYGQKFIMF